MAEFITWLGWRDHFFLVPGLGVGCVRANTFIRRPEAMGSRHYARREKELAVPHRRSRVDLCPGERPSRSRRLRERAAR